MTTFEGIRPMLEADDVRVTVDFYVDCLGFEVTNAIEDGAGGYEWVSLRRDGVGIMFQGRHFHDGIDEDHPARPLMTGSLYIDVVDVDALAADLQRAVTLAFGPVDQPHGMREIGLEDPNGYFISFGQPI